MKSHYESAIQFLSHFYNRTINRKEKHHVQLMNELLELCSIDLDDFEFVQIAGSCGKGSTAHFISSMLHENEIPHGLFTGPHLQYYEERFQVNQELVSREEFAQIVIELAGKLKSYPRFPEVGHMHMMILIALSFFKNHHIRLVIFENGVGGAADPSNVFNPALAVLTEITLDHCHLLGHSIPKITQDKLEIIKDSTQYVICGMINPEARALLVEKEKASHSNFVFYERDYFSNNECADQQKNLFDYDGIEVNLNQIHLPLIGKHQIQNAANALAAVECLAKRGFFIDWEKVRRGLEQVSISCRMEFVDYDGITFLFDGAHNSLELQTLKRNIRSLNLNVTKLILTVSSNKDIRDMMQSIDIEGAEMLLVPNPFIERRVSFAEITAHLSTLNHISYRTFDSIESSLQYLYQAGSSQNEITLVTGSLYLVGRIKNIIHQGD